MDRKQIFFNQLNKTNGIYKRYSFLLRLLIHISEHRKSANVDCFIKQIRFLKNSTFFVNIIFIPYYSIVFVLYKVWSLFKRDLFYDIVNV